MIGRVIEVASEGRHLVRKRGLMTVSADGIEDGRVPLDDIGVLLCNARGLSYSNDLMTELARRGIIVVLCGSNYLPVAWLWPLEGHHMQTLRMRRQLEASLPLRKRLWQGMVKAKIIQQHHVLAMLRDRTVACCHWPAVSGPATRTTWSPKRRGGTGGYCSATHFGASVLGQCPIRFSTTATQFCGPQ